MSFIGFLFIGKHNDPDYQKAVELTEKQESQGYRRGRGYGRGRGRGRGNYGQNGYNNNNSGYGYGYGQQQQQQGFQPPLQPYPLAYGYAQNAYVPQQQQAQPSQQAQFQHPSTIMCYNCGNVGHFAKYCPLRANAPSSAAGAPPK